MMLWSVRLLNRKVVSNIVISWSFSLLRRIFFIWFYDEFVYDGVVVLLYV